MEEGKDAYREKGKGNRGVQNTGGREKRTKQKTVLWAEKSEVAKKPQKKGKETV